MLKLLLAVLLMATVPQAQVTDPPQIASQGVIGFPAPAQDAPPVIDIALRQVRSFAGGSSIARSAVRGDESAFLYAGLGPCVVGASAEDPARENSLTWRASGRVRSVERGIAVADIEWQRLEYRPAGVVAGPRMRTTVTLPLGERVAVDFIEVSGSACKMDGLIYEIGVAADHGRRLAMSGEGRSAVSGAGSVSGGGAGGGVGRRLTPDELQAQAERVRQAVEAVRTSPVVARPMPPRQYNVDVWLVPEVPSTSTPPGLAQRQSQVIGGTGGRFDFPPIPVEAGNRSVGVEISALVIPIGGERLVVAITRHVTGSEGTSPVSSGWVKAVPLPKSGDVPSFEIPALDGILPRQGFGLRVRIGHPPGVLTW
jgi:hypothetical protein